MFFRALENIHLQQIGALKNIIVLFLWVLLYFLLEQQSDVNSCFLVVLGGPAANVLKKLAAVRSALYLQHLCCILGLP